MGVYQPIAMERGNQNSQQIIQQFAEILILLQGLKILITLLHRLGFICTRCIFLC